MQNKIQSITFGAVLLYICCYFMQLFGFPNILMLFLGAVLCLSMLINQKKLRIDAGICLLAFTMLSYSVILYGKRGIITMIPYVPMVIYVLANYLACDIRMRKESNEKLILVFLLLAAGYTIHGILNSGLYFAGYRAVGARRWQDIWQQCFLPGTQQVIFFLPALAMLFPAIAYFKKRKWINVLVVLVSVFFCYTSLATRSRMSLVILAIVFVLQAFLYVLYEREELKKNLSSKKFWIAAGIMVILAVAAVIALKDTDVVVAFIENMGKGGGILNNVRFQAQKLALEQLFDYPLGGRQMELGRSYAHNVWLDMANAVGIIPFFAFTAYTVFTIYEMIRFLIKKEIPAETKLIVTGLYTAFFLYFTVEPALDASIHYLTPWFFVNGFVHGYLSKKKEEVSA